MTTGNTEFSLNALMKYVSALSYETISRNPECPIRIAAIGLEHRQRLIVAASTIRSVHKSPAGQFCRWTIWTIDGFPGAAEPEPHLTGIKIVGGTRSYQTTSEVVAIAHDLSCVLTRSGKLYEITDESPELTNDGFMQVVSTLIAWGYQNALRLPPIY